MNSNSAPIIEHIYGQIVAQLSAAGIPLSSLANIVPPQTMGSLSQGPTRWSNGTPIEPSPEPFNEDMQLGSPAGSFQIDSLHSVASLGSFGREC